MDQVTFIDAADLCGRRGRDMTDGVQQLFVTVRVFCDESLISFSGTTQDIHHAVEQCHICPGPDRQKEIGDCGGTCFSWIDHDYFHVVGIALLAPLDAIE